MERFSACPLRFRRFLAALESGGAEHDTAAARLGGDFDPDAFDINACNARLDGIA